MKISSKEEYFTAIRKNDLFRSALDKVSERERHQIMATVEHIAGSLFEAIIPVIAQAKEDPQVAKDLSEALKSGGSIIKESDGSPIVKENKE